jgi:hypothetical protein
VLVDRVNVGGNESGQQSNFIVGGATASDNAFAVDGVIVSDMAAVGSSGSYYDFGAYEEIQLTTASTDTSIQVAGVTINQVTKRGTNEWRGDGRYLDTLGSLQSAPPQIFVPKPSPGHFADGSSIDGVKEYGGNIGGPLMKDHLWIWGSYGVSDIRNIIGAAQVQGQPTNFDKTKLEDTNAKLNFQLSAANSGTIHYWDNDKLKAGRSGNWNRPPETTWDQTTPATKWKFEDTQLIGSNFMISGLYSHDAGGFTLHPKGGNADIYQDGDGIYHGSFFKFDQSALLEQGKVDGSAFFKTGGWDNELKFGGSYRTQADRSISVIPNGHLVISCDWDSCPDPTTQAIVEFSRKDVNVKTKYKAVWAQDTISADRWTITGGVRWDGQTAQNLPLVDPGTPGVALLPRIDFKGDNASGLNWSALVPRVGITYAAGQDRRTLLRASYSAYSSQLGQWIPNYIAPTAAYSYVYYYFTDSNHNHKFDPNEPLNGLYYVYNVNTTNPTQSANQLAKHFNPYMTHELSFATEHSFANNFNVSANLIFRRTTDLLEAVPLVIDSDGNTRPARASDYVFDKNITGVLPNGKVVTVPTYTLNDSVTATGGNLLKNSDRQINYYGINLGFTKPLANHWSARGNFTYGDNKLHVGPGFKAEDDPTDRVSLGSGYYGDNNDIFVETSYGSHSLVLINSRWSFNVNGLYQVAPERPWGFNLSGSLSGREGFPYAPTNKTTFTGSGVQLSPSLGDFRLPSVISFDARIEKLVNFGDTGVTFSIDGFNLLDSHPALQRYPKAPSTEAGLATSYPVIENLSPRVFRLGMAIHFR